ncbi:hypothetical protein [Novosphingobium sp. 9U]|uniref:hypothetical protein n=1 Tax=Novosphingobium sp. 9U TaxID=2653158 RepID=UPI0012F15770|nr:hypothetical protein [Novosphingobium sp. 9U]VWX53308.1 conserved hypothetical protein [Novosphingobium sp. 9U]
MQMQDEHTGGGLRNELREDTDRVTGAAADRLQSEADSRKGQVADQARAVSSALGSAADGLGGDAPSWVKSALEKGAKSIEQLAQTVEGKDSRELMGDVQQFARQRPGSFLAGCALLGFAASRVFKAGGTQAGQTPSTSNQQASPVPQSYATYSPEGTGAAKPMMSFTDGGGAATSVSPTNVGTSL